MKKNVFDEKYDIRMARYDEIDEVMNFIDKYWKKGHILATNREFFEYEMVVDGHVNFVIAKDKNSNEIVGLHGYVMASRETENQDGWGSIWKVLPGTVGLLGLEIAKRMEMMTRMRAILALGANISTAVPHMRILRRFEDSGKMKHYYCLSNRDTYKIARVNHYDEFIANQAFHVNVTLLETMKDFSAFYDISSDKNYFPYKDEWYINHRYYEHPIYKYQVYGLKDDKNNKAIMICRDQEYAGEKALRIVDFIGKIELFAGVSHFLENKLKEYEYIDFYCYGIDTSYIEKAGMIERLDDDTNIIPNYFYPYLAENVDIWVGTPKGRATFFKADGDQDRPNY